MAAPKIGIIFFVTLSSFRVDGVCWNADVTGFISAVVVFLSIGRLGDDSKDDNDDKMDDSVVTLLVCVTVSVEAVSFSVTDSVVLSSNILSCTDSSVLATTS